MIARVERPLDLRERDEQMFAGQQSLTAAARLVFGARHDAQCAFGQLREIEVEIFHRRVAPERAGLYLRPVALTVSQAIPGPAEAP